MPVGCPSDDALAALLSGRLSSEESDELHRHIRGCPSCSLLLGELGAAVEVSAQKTGADADPAHEPGDRVGRFVLERLVGVGGMGAVWAARDPELGRAVAVKLVRPGLWRDGDAAQQRRRLLQEAKVMAHLAHPNVVPVFEVGEAGEQLFVVMELVEGETLGKWLGRPHPRAEIVRVFIAAGEGLAAAHAAGIVHRDFKPDNVLIGADGRARVTDFGLARTPASLPEPVRQAPLALAADDSSPTLTPLGALLGTPAYMAPEQLDGAPASASSDLFAYCTALYEALYGVRPFAGSTLLAIRQAIRAGAVREPPRVQRAPEWLHRLVLSGLQADPAARPASMNVLLAGLRADPQRARRLLAGAALLVLLAAGAGVLAQRAASARAASCAGEAAIVESAWSPGRREAMHASFRASGLAWSEPTFTAASKLLDRYASGWSEMRKDACEATRIRHQQPEETLALRAACLDDRRRELGALTDLFLHADRKIIDHAVAASAALTELDLCANVSALAAPIPRPRDPTVRARLDAAVKQVEEAEARYRLGLVSKETEALAAAALAEIRAVGHAPSESYAELILSQIEWRLGNLERTLSLEEDALVDGTRGRDDVQVIATLSVLTQTVGQFAGRTEEGLRYSRLAFATIERAGNRPRDLIDAKDYRSNVFWAAGRLDEALADKREVVAALEKSEGPDSMRLLQKRSNLGVVLSSMGRIEDELALISGVVPAMEKLVGVGNPSVLLVKNNLGSALLTVGRIAEATPIIESATREMDAAYGGQGLYFATALTTLAELRLANRQFAEGLEVVQRAIAIIEKIAPDHPELCEPLTQAGLALIGLGRAAESVPLLERALAIAKTGSAPTDRARIQFALARGLLALHREPERAAGLVADGRKAWTEAAARWGGENARFGEELAPALAMAPER